MTRVHLYHATRQFPCFMPANRLIALRLMLFSFASPSESAYHLENAFTSNDKVSLARTFNTQFLILRIFAMLPSQVKKARLIVRFAHLLTTLLPTCRALICSSVLCTHVIHAFAKERLTHCTTTLFRQSGKQSGSQSGRQSSRQLGRQSGRQSSKQAGRQSGMQSGRQ